MVIREIGKFGSWLIFPHQITACSLGFPDITVLWKKTCYVLNWNKREERLREEVPYIVLISIVKYFYITPGFEILSGNSQFAHVDNPSSDKRIFIPHENSGATRAVALQWQVQSWPKGLEILFLYCGLNKKVFPLFLGNDFWGVLFSFYHSPPRQCWLGDRLIIENIVRGVICILLWNELYEDYKSM